MQPYLLSVLSGLMLTASFPNTDWNFLAWCGFVPLFRAIEGRSGKDTFKIGYVGGVAFFWSLLYWLNNVTVAGFFVLTIYLALYFPFFALGVNFLRRRSTVPVWISAPLLWTALEFVRTYAFTGLPWGLLGVTQYRFTALIQVASLTGVYGVSTLVMLVNTAIDECIRCRGRGCAAPIAAGLVALVACVAYGSWRLVGENHAEKTVRVGIVQGNVPQEEKFGQGFREGIVQRFHDLTLEVAREKPDLIVWPETSVPGYYWYDPYIYNSIAELQREVGKPLLFGSEHMIEGSTRKYFNCAFLVDARGEPVERYDKIHLVLFGEIVPCKWLFPFLMKLVPYEDDFSPGERFTVFPLEQGNFASLICFEDVMPDLARNFVRRGARFLVNITNAAWFGRTSQPYQQMAHAVFRCVENRVPMVRATNTGVSCSIDRYGRISRILRDRSGEELFVQGTAVFDVALARANTFYTRRGNLWAMACGAAILLIFIMSGKRKSDTIQ